MNLKYKDEELEDKFYEEFLKDTDDEWSQRERPSVRDFIKWAIIKGYLKNSPLENMTATLGKR